MWEELTYYLLILFSVLFGIGVVVLHVYIYARRNLSPASKIPGFSGNFYIGTILRILKGPHIGAVEVEWLKTMPDTPLLRFNFLMGENKILVTDPDIMKHVLITNAANYNKNLSSYHSVKKYFLGNGLVTLDGNAHTHHRSLINEAFNYRYLKNFVHVFALQTRKLIDIWDLKDGELVSVQRDLFKLSLSIIGLTSFGYDFNSLNDDPNAEGKSLGRKFLTAMKNRASFLSLIMPFWNNLPVPDNVRKIKRRDELNSAVEEVIRTKEENLKNAQIDFDNYKPRDLLEIVINLKDENGQSLCTSDLRDEAKTFIIAGFETTSTAINFTLFLLARHPEHIDIIRKEVEDVMGDRELVEPEDIEKFKYLNMVIKESMRMYPPVPAVARYCVESETIAGYTIPKGTAVQVTPYVLHHHPKYWKEPERFDPLRWTPEEVAKRNPYLYLPFLLGPRNCIGQKFGMMEVKCVLAMILRRYDFSLPPDWEMIPRSFISLRATPKVKMYIRSRVK